MNTTKVGGPVGRRLVGAFLLAAFVPLAVSDWLSTRAVSDVATSLADRTRIHTVRQASRQVFDRLLAAEAVLESMRLAGATPEAARAIVAGDGRMFIALVALTNQVEPHSSDLYRRWKSKSADVVLPTSLNKQRVWLRTYPKSAVLSGVLLASDGSATPTWIAELNTDFVWSPIIAASDDFDWRVTDSAGHVVVVLHNGGIDQGAEIPPANDPTRSTQSTLFLQAEFGASDWTFDAIAPVSVVRWAGLPLSTWLVLVATATLLVIAFVSRRLISRILLPLGELNDGAERLASGLRDTRVQVRRADEFGALAGTFNDMASRIDLQWSTLENFASLDRGILERKPMRELAAAMLAHLAAPYPNVDIALAWLDQESRFHLSAVHNGAATTAECALDATQVARFHRLRENIDVNEPDEAIAVFLRWSGDSGPRCRLVVGGPGGTVAVLELAGHYSSDAIRPARDVRDRLAVALSAMEREDELVRRAMHDSLTGLSSRYALHSTIDELLDAEPDSAVALLLIDLDHFKNVNDSRGHSVGDELLCLASGRLLQAAPPSAEVARQGGDEFAIVLTGADASTAPEVARRVVDALSTSFDLSTGTHVLGASVGIAWYPTQARTREDLLRCADIALYEAKATGRSRFCMFTDNLDSATRHRVEMEADLRVALERRQFEMYYQPRVSAADEHMTSAEALIRWKHPVRGVVMPDAFIPLAESTGLIDEIGHWVLRAVCMQVAQWRRDGVGPERVSLNVSACQLISGAFPEHVVAALDAFAVPAHVLEFEITESVLVGDVDSAFAQLTRLRTLGASIALDDFGTGYSSMAMLARLPLDVLKIDRTFVATMRSEPRVLAIVRAIAAIAEASKLTLVAEGVETLAQAEELRLLGCDELQGYRFGRPAPAETLGAMRPRRDELLDERARNSAGKTQRHS